MAQTNNKAGGKKKRYAEIETVSIIGLTAEMGPVGLLLYANSFLAAALVLPEPGAPFDPVRPYLVCHSIELALKAFLSLKGSKMVDLSNGTYGHKLEAILTNAEEVGLAKVVKLTDEQTVQIRKATEYYNGKVFEYPAVGEAIMAYPSMPYLPVLIDAAKVLVESLREPCK